MYVEMLIGINRLNGEIVLIAEKFALNVLLQTIQILKNDVQILIFCHSYFIATVIEVTLL